MKLHLLPNGEEWPFRLLLQPACSWLLGYGPRHSTPVDALRASVSYRQAEGRKEGRVEDLEERQVHVTSRLAFTYSPVLCWRRIRGLEFPWQQRTLVASIHPQTWIYVYAFIIQPSVNWLLLVAVCIAESTTASRDLNQTDRNVC